MVTPSSICIKGNCEVYLLASLPYLSSNSLDSVFH